MGARRDGVDVQTHVFSVFRYRDGRPVERWLYPDDTVASNAIFAAWRASGLEGNIRPGGPGDASLAWGECAAMFLEEAES